MRALASNQLDCDNATVNPSGCDDVFWNIPVDSHNVQIADQLIETLAISTNGLVIFNYTDEDTSADTFSPQELPSGDRPNNIIAPFWIDLVLGSNSVPGDVYYGRVANGDDNWAVIEWWNAIEWTEAGSSAEDPSYTFSLWMKENSDEIYLNYASLGALPALLSVGIEDGGGASGISYYFSGTGEAPTENSSHQIDIASFKGSATINFDVMTRRLLRIQKTLRCPWLWILPNRSILKRWLRRTVC